MTNKAPEYYAHPLTGNSIPQKSLEPLLQHVPIPLHWLGEAIFGLETRPWNNQIIVNIINILFGPDLNHANTLSQALLNQIIPLLKIQMKSLQEMIESTNVLSEREQLARMVGLDLFH
jgi:hypothetical protein